jgi:hypothetical protein
VNDTLINIDIRYKAEFYDSAIYVEDLSVNSLLLSELKLLEILLPELMAIINSEDDLSCIH